MLNVYKEIIIQVKEARILERFSYFHANYKI